jgi:hypothetical protein
MTDATTRKCGHCGERFNLSLRSGRTRTNKRRTLHEGRRYCSDTCRKLASKTRRTPFKTPNTGSVSEASMPDKAPQATRVLSTVTTAPNLVDLSAVSGAQKSGGAGLQVTFGGYTVVPSIDWPGMYRVRMPDGSLTDMANLTRARDAARCFANQERRIELQEAA